MDVFLTIANSSIWEHIAIKTFEEMDRKYRLNEITDNVYSKYYKKRPSELEIMQAFALRQQFRSKKSQ